MGDPALGERVRETFAGQGTGRTAVAVQSGHRYLRDAMPDRAASLAYYGMLSLFPSLMIVSAAIRLVGGNSAAKDVSTYADDHGASDALAGALRSVIDTAQSAPAPSAGVVGLAGLLALVYGASRAFTAAGRALDTIGGRPPTGRSLARRAQDIGWTLLLVAMGIAVSVLLALSGRVLSEFLGLFGISGAAASIYGIARWPVAIALALVATAIIRWASPTGARPAFRVFTLGAVVSVAAWLAASIGFAIYIATFASYNETYGAFAGSVILLLWIWLGSAALLYGAELDAVLEERRPTVVTELTRPEAAPSASRTRRP
jgi:membrane protein